MPCCPSLYLQMPRTRQPLISPVFQPIPSRALSEILTTSAPPPKALLLSMADIRSDFGVGALSDFVSFLFYQTRTASTVRSCVTSLCNTAFLSSLDFGVVLSSDFVWRLFLSLGSDDLFGIISAHHCIARSYFRQHGNMFICGFWRGAFQPGVITCLVRFSLIFL